MRNWQAVALTIVLAMALVGPILVQAGVKKSDLAARIAALEAAAAMSEFVTVVMGPINGLAGPHIIIEGANVHIRNDTGTTDLGTDGLGNLIIGYNEDFPGAIRTGSHNLVVGEGHDYTSYGGFVAGHRNTVSGTNATVSGGQFNTASGDHSSVSGGEDNTASDLSSSVSGGLSNVASGQVSSVSGGSVNTASGFRSSVSGGSRNEASFTESSVSGGSFNTASGSRSSVSGGSGNEASGDNSSVSGGRIHVASGSESSVSGGFDNLASGVRSSVSGGRNCTVAVTLGFGVGDTTSSSGCLNTN